MLITFFLFFHSSSLFAEEPSTVPEDDFSHYLADHMQALRPVMEKYAPEWSQESLPLIWQMEMPLLYLNVGIFFFLNLILGRLYAALFSPAQATLRHSFYFALCNLFQVVIGTVLIMVCFIFALQNFSNQGVALLFLVLALIVGLASLVSYVILIMYFYRTGFISAVGLMLLFLLAALIISIPARKILLPLMSKTDTTQVVWLFIDEKVSPKILLEAQAAKTDFATAEQARFNAQKSIDENQGKIIQIQAQKDELQKKITDWLASDAYTLSLIGPIRAKGDLLQAEKAYQNFLLKYPGSSYTDVVKGQLNDVTTQYAAEQLAKQQREALAALAAQDYQTKLLERVKTTGVSLSELHQFLLGKTREQVRELFGSPTDTAADRWGYSQILAMDPLNNHTFGVAITFQEGIVQSLDYYYGGNHSGSSFIGPDNATNNPANISQ